MSGVAGADRVKSRQDFAQFLTSYKDLISQFPGFVSINPSGSYNSNPNKMDFGDIDLIVHIKSNKDKATVKKELQAFFHAQPETRIVPFSSEKHAGKRSYNAGELVSIRYHDDQLGYSAQIDNIVALDQYEMSFKQHFLDMPAEKQGLVLGLVKVATIETAPAILFKKLGINAPTELGTDQEYEFNLSSVKLELRKVVYEPGTFKQLEREIIWSSQNWEDLQKLLYQYDLDASFEELLNKTKQVIKNPRSSQRIQGVFASMITVKSGEVGTAKGAGKEAALDKIRQTFSENKKQIRLFNALLENVGPDTLVFTFGRFQIPTNGHKLLIEEVKKTAQQHHADYAIFVSKKVGDTTATKYANPLSIDQKMPYITEAFPGVNFVPCNEQMGTIIHIAQHINQKYKKIIMVAGRDRMEGKLNFKELLERQNGIDFQFDNIQFVIVDRDPDAESSSQMKEFVKQDDWDSFRRDLPSTLDDQTAHQLWDDLKINLAPVPRKSRKTKESGYIDNGSPESRRPGVGSANYVSMPGGIGIKENRKPKAVPSDKRDTGALATRQHIANQERKHKEWDEKQADFYRRYPEYAPKKADEAMLPKSAFAGSKKNKLGSAGQLNGNMKRPARAGDLVGGGCEEGVTEAIGPHNGKELELMIKGKKPAALIFPHDMAKWRPYIEKFGWIVTPFKGFGNYDCFAISKDPYSGKQISQLFQQVIASGQPPTDSFHEKLGRLLGYSEQDISDFLSNKAKKRAQVPVNEDIERIMAGYIKILASK